MRSTAITTCEGDSCCGGVKRSLVVRRFVGGHCAS